MNYIKDAFSVGVSNNPIGKGCHTCLNSLLTHQVEIPCDKCTHGFSEYLPIPDTDVFSQEEIEGLGNLKDTTVGQPNYRNA